MAKRKRLARGSTRPKGSYPLPSGGYVSTELYVGPKTGRQLRVRAMHRAEVDPKAVAHVLLGIVLEQQRDEQDQTLT